MNRGMRRFNAGLHLKTAGTTWLEEIIGLAEADGDGLKLAQQIYQDAYGRFDELRKPYATVIDIDWNALPTPNAVNAWTAQQFTNALRHDEKCPAYNPNFRQMLHVAFKVAAELGNDYLNAIAIHADCVAKNVSANLLERHIKPLFYPQN